MDSARQPSPRPSGWPPADESALEAEAQAFTDNFDYLVRTLRRLGVRPIDVEDLAQDVFVVMCRRWSEYRSDRPLRPWLAGIAFNVARKHLGRFWRETLAPEIDAEDQQLLPDETLQAHRARQLVLRALELMRPRDRAILSLCELDEVTVDDAAALLAIPRFTAYSRLRRARERFAEVVAKLQRCAPAVPTLSPSALLAIERAPVVRRPDSERRARRVIRAAIGRMAPPARSPAGPAVAVALAVVALVGFVASYRITRHAPAPRIATPSIHAGLERALAGRWTFDDAAGSATARDSSPGRHDCRLHELDPRGAWVDGVHGGAVAISHGWLECPQAAVAADARTPMSVALWVKPAAFTSSHAAIVTRQLRDGPSDYFFLGTLGRRLTVRSSLWAKHLTAPDRLSLDRWVHVAFTHDADGTMRLYQDGVEVVRAQATSRARATVTAPLALGASVNGPGQERGQPFTGMIDELTVWDRALVPEEVATLARAGRTH